MYAWVLSGGGAKGALEAGALMALSETNDEPDFMVGSSVGAINAVGYLVDDLSLSVVNLWESWANTETKDILDIPRFTWPMIFVDGRNHISSNKKLHNIIQNWMPKYVTRFDQLRKDCFVVTCNRSTGKPIVLGGLNDQSDIAPALLASTAFPGILPPVTIEKRELIDGGVIANVPVTIARDKGATRILVISVIDRNYQDRTNLRFAPLDALYDATRIMRAYMTSSAIEEVQRDGVEIHYLQLDTPFRIPTFDFRHSKELLEIGYVTTRKWMDNYGW